MKTFLLTLLLSLLIVFLATASLYFGQDQENPGIVQDTIVKYQDGFYEGQSKSIYTDEPYWGIVQMKIEKGQFTIVRFMIRDTNLHETFNQFYEKHFEKIPEYLEQCRNDWKGVQSYPGKLLEKQNINKVDATSGATWSYNIFKSSADSALKKAVIK